MTTITRRIAAARRTRPRVYFTVIALPALLVAALAFASLTGGSGGINGPRPNLSLNIAGVTCATAYNVNDEFVAAVNDATKASPNYSGVQAFGFAPPVNPGDISSFRDLLRVRAAQLDLKAKSATAGECTDSPTASVTDTNGKTVTLPLVDGDQPGQPINGSESNRDSRTAPVTLGTDGDALRTNTWGDLNDLYGDQKWYTNCANSNLDMRWGTDVPKFRASEEKHDSRFILAVNTTLSDGAIRQKAASDGNPNVDKLPIVRVDSIINTRHLNNNRCDPFIDARSMVRVSLGKVVFDNKGNFKGLETDKGAFVDCHNLWRLPKTPPIPTTPRPSPTPSHPGTPVTTPPHSTPPTTQPPTCTNGGTPPKCLEAKDPNQGAAHQGNVPTQVQGKKPPAGPTSEPKPPAPPKTYTPPAPPTATTQPAPPRTTVPPQESPAPQPSDPVTGTHCPPGIPTC